MKKICIIIFVILFNLLFASNNDMEKYADFLMKTKDYFRAISVFKKLNYFEKNESKKSLFNFSIAKAYFKANKYELSTEYLYPLLQNNDKNITFLSNIYMGLNFIALQTKNQAKIYFLEAEKIEKNNYGLLCLSYIQAQNHNWNTSIENLNKIKLLSKDSSLSQKAKELEILYKNHYKINKKNPFLAGFFSAIVPGSGQTYAGQYFNGFMAFGYVTGLAYCTFLSYCYENDHSKNYVSTTCMGFLAGTFHISNIIGAYKATSYYNMRQEELFFKPIKIKIFEVNY